MLSKQDPNLDTPRDAVEEDLLDVWRGVLKIPKLGINDNFFELGGDEAQSVLIASQALTKGISIKPKDVFDRPTVAELAELVRGPAVTHQPTDPSASEPFSLSPVQKGMLFHSLSEPGVYLQQLVTELKGSLDVDLLKSCWKQVIAAHEALRAEVVMEGVDEPAQRVVTTFDLPLQVAAVSSEEKVEALIEADRRTAIVLTKAPAMRLLLLERDEQHHILVWTHHHMFIDGWSAGLVLEQVTRLYAAGGKNGLHDLPEQSCYRELLSRSARLDPDSEANYWRGVLGEVDEPTPLPWLVPDEKGQTGAVTADLARKDSDLLKTFAREQRITLSTLLLAAYALSLSRAASAPTVLVGVTVSGRPAEVPGSESCVGMFINTLPARIAVPESDSVANWLQSVQLMQLELLEHQHSALNEIRGLSQIPPGTTLFDSIFVFENFPEVRPEAGPVKVERMRALERPHYPLTVYAAGGPTLTIGVNYDGVRITEVAARLVLDQVRDAALALARAPDAAVGKIASKNLRVALPTLPRRNPVHVEILDRTREFPNAEAISSEDSTWNYSELVKRAGGFAAALRRQEVKRGDIVAVVNQRSPDTIAAWLGTMMLGAAYLPIDPSLPKTRIDFMLQDSGASAVVTTSSTRESFESRVPLLLCEDVKAEAAPEAATVSDDDLAYVIYTSGSTGTPKAVAITHGGLANLVAWHNHTYSVGTSDHASHIAGLGFDAAVWEVWPYLCAGASIRIPDEEVRVDPAALTRWLREERVTIGFIPTPLADALLAAGSLGDLPNLRAVLTGGDRLTHRPRSEGPSLYNHYGPTECTVVATAGLVSPKSSGVPDIGKPIDGARVYLLDHGLRLSPEGAPGEIFIAGTQVARGYLKRPSLTAERFLPDPFGPPGSRMYRTGDIAKWLPDGAIEFIGRLDDQVKVRGYRIELGEIEATLTSYPGISQAAVVAADRALTGFVAGSDIDADSVRDHCLESLPEYMVPSQIVVRGAMPLTSNGKIDRKALIAPHRERSTQREPRDDLETLLLEIWRKVFKGSDISVGDNFFELGGDSITSIQIVAQASSKGIGLTPKQIFAAPTVEGVAQLIRQTTEPGPKRAAEDPTSGAFPLTPIQHWLLHLAEGDIDHFNMAVMLKPRERLESGPLSLALQAVVRHHDQLRMRLDLAPPEPRQTLAQEELSDVLWTADLSSIPTDEQSSEIERLGTEAQTSLRLGEGPVLRAVLIEMGGGEQRLLVVIHHMAVDAISWGVIIEDLTTAYNAAVLGSDMELPPKTESFKAWAESQVRFAESTGAMSQQRFWLDHLRSTEDTGLEPGRWGEAALEQVAIPVEVTRQIERVCRLNGWRLDAAVLSAVAAGFALIADDPHVLVDVEGHGRNALGDEIDVSRTVGWFTSLFPVVVATGSDVAASVGKTSRFLSALPAGGAGFGALAQLGPEEIRAEFAQLPRPNVGFNYVGRLDEVGGTLFESTDEDAGPVFSPTIKRAHAIDVDAGISGERLTLFIRFRKDLPIDEFVAETRKRLEEVASMSRDLEDISDSYPLSPLQEGILFHSLDADAGQYHEQISFWIDEALDPAVLQAAWDLAAKRHEVLRTFVTTPASGPPRQVVRQQGTVPVQVEDLTEASEVAQDALLHSMEEEDLSQAFDLLEAPLMRFRAARLAEDRWRVLWSYHHLILDGWSASILMNEVLEDYVALKAGAGLPDRPSPAKPRDYIALIGAQVSREPRSHWERELNAATPANVFRGNRKAGASGHLEKTLDEPTTTAVRKLSSENQVTMAAIAHTAWGLVLASESGRGDLLFGSTTSGREISLEGIESAVGLFINTLPIRLQVKPTDDLGSISGRIQHQLLDISRLHYSQLVEVQRWAGISAETPMFDSVVVFENYPEAGELPLKVRPGKVVEKTNYPVTLAVDGNGTMRIRLLYDGENVDRDRAEQLLQSFVQTLRSMTERTLELPHLEDQAPVAEPVPRRIDLEETAMTPVESVVARAWSEVLETTVVSRTDNFFELGGHSLSATQVVSRLRSIFGSRLPVRLPFESPTVDEMAARVVSSAESLEAAEALAAAWLRGSARPRAEVIPRTSAASPRAALIQEFAWNLHKLDPKGPTYNVGGAVRYRGRLNDESLERAVLEIARRHEPLRTTFSDEGGSLRQIVGGTEPHFERIDLKGTSYEDATALVGEKLSEPFDLAHGPLVRSSLIKLAPEDHLFFVGMHHIITDGWSMGVFQRELAALYSAYSSGERPRLRRLPIRYADFAEWQRDSLDRGDFDDQIEWWQDQLRGAPPYVDYPTDHPRPPRRTFQGDSIQVDLPPELWHQIRLAATAHDATPYMVMFAALNTMLYGESGQTDIVTGSPTAARNYMEIEDLIGLFLNNMALRVKLKPSESFAKLIGEVKQTVLDAFTRTDVPYNRLIENLDIPEDPSRAEIYQVSLNMINTPPGGFDLPGVESEMILAPEIRAKQDMTFYAQEMEGTLTLQLVFNSIIFERSRMETLVRRFLEMTKAGTSDPSLTLPELVELGAIG